MPQQEGRGGPLAKELENVMFGATGPPASPQGAQIEIQPIIPLLKRADFTRICQAVRALVKDRYHASTNGSAGEGEAFHKLSSVRLRVTIDGQELLVKVVVRSYEAAIADGFILVWQAGLKDMPSDEASYHEWWAWTRNQKQAHFIPFDLKTLTLKQSTGSRANHYYNWTENSTSSDEQSEHVQFIIALVEGVDDYMAIVPIGAWNAVRELSFGIESIAHTVPLWLPLFMVADADLESAITEMVACALHDVDYTNPTNNVVFVGWRIDMTKSPKIDPGNWKGLEASFANVMNLWNQVQLLGGHVVFNPFAPLMIDFALWLKDIGTIWTEHKGSITRAKSFKFEKELRRSPFQQRRLWHMLCIQCKEELICIMRDEIPSDGSWAGLVDLPKEFVKNHVFKDFAHALPHIKYHAFAARDAVAAALRNLEPEDINQGLSGDEAGRALKSDNLRSSEHDPLTNLIIRLRSVPGIQRSLNYWSRVSGKGVCLALGHGCGLGAHLMVKYDWNAHDKQEFDLHGRLPLYLHSPNVSNLRCVPLRCQDHSLPSNVGKQWFPFGLRKENWQRVLESPRSMVIGSLLDSHCPGEWLLVLPSGFVDWYQPGQQRESKAGDQHHNGAHLFWSDKLDNRLITEPAWKSKRSTVNFNDYFLVDKDINLGRYVLSLHDGTVHREIYKVVEGAGPIFVANPVLRGEQSREFIAEEYQTKIGEAMQMLWTVGYDKQDQPNAGEKMDDDDRCDELVE